MEDHPIENKSKFNSAVAKLQRIDQMKKDAYDARLNQDYRKWYQCLLCVRSEINGKLNEKEKIKCDTYKELIEDGLEPKRDYTIATPFFVNTATNINYRAVREMLNKYELYLVDLEEKKGIGLINEDDDEGL